VEVQYLSSPCSDYVAAAAEAALAIHSYEGRGDILVFLPGAEEIERCAELIRDGLPAAVQAGRFAEPEIDGALIVAPLYAALPWEQQLAALEPGPIGKTGHTTRKVVIATNIAETSVTVEGVVFVIDSGYTRMPVYEPETGIDALLTVPVSRAAAQQRAGRAGRVRRGKCLRLYPEHVYTSVLPAATAPEVVRRDLAPVVLSLLALGVADVAHFDYLDAPSPMTLVRALELLLALGAVDAQARLTRPVGAALADLPAEPRPAAMLLAALASGCAEQAITVAAMTAVQGIFLGWRPGAPKKEQLACDDAVRVHRPLVIAVPSNHSKYSAGASLGSAGWRSLDSA
jgi:HrpA-like RNA helicase